MKKLSERDEEGKLPSYAWPGGYPMYYIDTGNLILCPDCANYDEENYSDPIVAADVHWEGEPLISPAAGLDRKK